MENMNMKALHELYNQKQGKEYSQKQFAEKLGISASNLSLLESGKKRPSIGEAMAYRELLGVSLDYIFGCTEHPEPVKYEMGAVRDIAGNTEENAAAVKAMNHLIGDYDCLAFFTLLDALWQKKDALWQTERQNRPDMLFSIENASGMAQCFIAAKTFREAFPLQCKLEQVILEYILSHPYNDEDGNGNEKLDDIIPESSPGKPFSNAEAMDDIVDDIME